MATDARAAERRLIMAIVRDNCKNCKSSCEHAGKEREFICPNGISCKVTHEPPKTNGDRIRSMDDEVLSVQFVQVVKETIKFLTELDLPDEISSEIRLNLLEKLKQPAEVTEDG